MWSSIPNPYRILLAAGGIFGVLIITLLWMGRVPYCECGFGLWTSETVRSPTSQHFADPYSFTHILHGIVLYGIVSLFGKRLSISQKLLIVLGIEAGWEILENTPWIINRYRADTISYDYTGDSILNSVGDMLCCAFGGWFASRYPIRGTIALVAIIELTLGFLIRDNLTLNIIMLLIPIPGIREWQLGL